MLDPLKMNKLCKIFNIAGECLSILKQKNQFRFLLPLDVKINARSLSGNISK